MIRFTTEPAKRRHAILDRMGFEDSPYALNNAHVYKGKMWCVVGLDGEVTVCIVMNENIVANRGIIKASLSDKDFEWQINEWLKQFP